MSTTILTPGSVQNIADWTIGSGTIGIDDGLYCEQSPPGPAPSGYLLVYDMVGSVIPPSDNIVGIKLYFDAGVVTTPFIPTAPNTTYDLEFSLCKTGSTPVGNSKRIDVDVQLNTVLFTLGGASDLWGTSFTPSEAQNIRILVRRPGNNTDLPGTTEDIIEKRLLDYVIVEVYHSASGGSLVAERESVKQKILFGKEVTHGTSVSCTNQMLGAKINPSMQGDFKGWRPQGMKNEQVQMLLREWASSNVTGIPTYDEMGYLLASVIGIPQSTGGVVNQRNVHTFRLDNRYEQDIQTYTFEYGTPDSRAHKCSYGFFDALNLNFSRSEAELGGSWIGRNITDGITMSAGSSEVQKIAPVGSPTGGTFKLRFKGAETAAITFSAVVATLATNIQTALNAIATIGVGGVAAAVNGSDVDVTFSGSSLTGQQQPMIELSSNSLTGGTTPTLTITQVTAGGFIEDSLIPVLPGHIDIYMADSYDTLSANKLTRARVANFSIANRADPVWYMDSSVGSFLKHAESPIEIKFNLELQADSNGMALLTTARNSSPKLIRILATGPLIAGSDYHKLQIDAYVKVSAFGNLSDSDGIYQSSFELTVAEDPSWGNTCVVTLENGKIGY